MGYGLTADIPKFAFEACGQTAGYYFQLRYALYKSLLLLRKDPTCSIAMERLDDVSVQSNGDVAQVQQLKHSTNDDGSFSDNSLAIWKTISNWIKFLAVDAIDFSKLSLVFVTNVSVGENTGIHKLTNLDGDRDVQGAIEALLVAAKNSSNVQTAKYRQEFLSLDPVLQQALIQAITVVPNSPGLAALASEIEEILYYACEPSQISEFRESLEGWWLNRVSVDFSQGKSPIVSLLEIEEKISSLREKFKRLSLEIDIEEVDLNQEDLNDHIFVQQVRKVMVGEKRLRNAQRDYLQASSQRSKWLRELRLDPAELNRYDVDLENRWKTQSAILHDESPNEATDADKCKEGRILLAWAETQQVAIRGASAQFLTSGSFHVLADQVRIGWHRDFETLFKVE